MIPVKSDTPSVKSSTVVSMRTSVARGVNRPAYCTSRSRPTKASSSPPAPPASARIRLSVTSCRSSRPWLAPSAVRSASSRSRRMVRATARFATLAQTMRSTKPAVLTRMRSVDSKCRVNSRRSGLAASA